MNEVAEGCVPPAEMDFFENTSKDSILDAKYYLVRPKGSKTVYIMDLKPEYNKGPFYKACEKNMSYLNTYCISLFRVPCENGYNSLFVIGLVPDEDSIAYIFDEPKENKMDLKKASTDTYKVDNEVAIHYGLFDWHIPMLLINEPFKKYIQEHLDEVEELVILARSISIDVAIHNQLFSDKPVSGLDADDGFEDAIYPVRPEA